VARTVSVVPHTHWDREWYAPFQAFRLRLVDLLDDLLPRLEADPSARFLFDGQLAAVDDYLALRPAAEGRLRRLVTTGQVAMGPWYVLPDEFCVSGETLVRNLEMGLRRAEDFGGAMAVGYLPDMFGHVAQMPQLLRLGGFEHAVVWRGVPAAVDRTGFWWSAPDGSTVRAEYLPVGYGNGAAVPDDAQRLVARVRAHEAELGPLLGPGTPLLWMNGSDHQRPRPWLARVVAEANALQDDYRLVITTLAGHLAHAPVDGLASWTGELRSGARANLLMGVLSNRVDVKQAAARAERSLERRAEPLCALFLAPEGWPTDALGAAWLEVVRNAAHDSCCACSADEVVDAVLHRYAESRQIGDGLAQLALDALGRSLADAGPVAVNPTARDRSGLVELVLSGDPPAGAQVLSAHPAGSREQTVTGSEIGTLLGQVTNRALADGGRVCSVNLMAVEREGDVLEVRLTVAAPSQVSATVTSDLSELYARAGAHANRPARVRVDDETFTRVLVRVEDVPAFGWRVVDPGAPASVEPVRADGSVLDNGLVRVEVDGERGTFSIDGLGGLDRLVDGGDAGDTYNWSPPAGDEIVDRPEAVAVEVGEEGPLRATLVVTRTYVWPECVLDGHRAGTRHVEAETCIEVRAGERLARVTTTFSNHCRDHRLRALFPLPDRASTSLAECAFGLVERGLQAEGGPHEVGLPTFPSRRFVQAGGLTVVHEGLLEYELVDDGRALALTLLRSVGVLSGIDLATRPQPAGPPLITDGAQMQGRRVFRYALVTGDVDPWAVADDANLALEVAWGSGRGTRPPAGSELSVRGAQVSAVRRVPADGSLEVRVFNPRAEQTTVMVPRRSGRLVDLRGREVERFDTSFSLRPWGIATVRLD